MASLPSVAAPPSGVVSPSRHKYRLRFRKSGDLRFISHIDLLHVFERMFRRAELSVANTQGFHPKPRVTFAQALALGVLGQNEVVEIEFTEPMSDDEVLQRLCRSAPPGIEFLACQTAPHKTPAQARRAFYRLTLPEPIADLPDRCAGFLAEPSHWIERTRPQRRRFDLRPFVSELTAAPTQIDMALWITPTGAARPEEIANALGLSIAADERMDLQRTHLEILDELPETERWLPVIPRFSEPSTAVDEETVPAERSRAAPLPTPLLANPLSFDS